MHIRISKENKEEIIRSLKNYFYDERSEDLGDLASHNLLDFIGKEIGPYFYNQGVIDAKIMVEQRMMHIEEDILSLERPIKKKI